MKKIHFLLIALTLTIWVSALVHFATVGQSFVQPSEFLRLSDWWLMLPLPLLTVGVYYLLKYMTVYESPARGSIWYVLVNLVFAAGTFLYGAGLGDHALAGYLNARYCLEGQLGGKLCEIITYNDDYFSHYVWLAGFLLMTVGFLGVESMFPRKDAVGKKHLVGIMANALVAALAIFVSTAFDRAGIDLVIYGLIALAALIMLAMHGLKKQPVTVYFAITYALGALFSFLYKNLS